MRDALKMKLARIFIKFRCNCSIFQWYQAGILFKWKRNSYIADLFLKWASWKGLSTNVSSPLVMGPVETSSIFQNCFIKVSKDKVTATEEVLRLRGNLLPFQFNYGKVLCLLCLFLPMCFWLVSRFILRSFCVLFVCFYLWFLLVQFCSHCFFFSFFLSIVNSNYKLILFSTLLMWI